jgi:hypothetical protein
MLAAEHLVSVRELLLQPGHRGRGFGERLPGGGLERPVAHLVGHFLQ